MGERVELEAELVPMTGAGTSALTAITRGELDVQIATAKTYPRDAREFIENATRWATEDAETSESCVYSRYVKDRDGKDVEIRGPSIRLAEIIAQAYGNLRVASRLVAELERFVVVEAVAHDLERNNAQRAEVVVSIWSSKWKRRFSQDVIQSNILAAQAKARRNAILAVVPGAWVRRIMQAVEAVNRKEQKTLGERVQKMASYLQNRLKVPLKNVLLVVGKSSLEQLTSDDLIRIRSLVDDIQEGTLSISQAFPDPAPAGSSPPAKQEPEAKGLQDLVDEAATMDPQATTGSSSATQASKQKSEPASDSENVDDPGSGRDEYNPPDDVKQKAGKLKGTGRRVRRTAKKQPAHPWATAEGEDLDGHIAHLEDAAGALEGDLIAEAQEAAPGSLDPDATTEQLRAYCDALHERITAATAKK